MSPRRPLRIQAKSSQAKAFRDFIEPQESVILETLRQERGFVAIFQVDQPLIVFIPQRSRQPHGFLS